MDQDDFLHLFLSPWPPLPRLYFHDTLVVSQWPIRLLNDSVVLRSSRDVGFDFSTVYATEHRTVFDLCSLLVLLDDLTDSVVFFFVVIVGD